MGQSLYCNLLFMWALRHDKVGFLKTIILAWTEFEEELMQFIYLITGILSLGLGIVGIFVPLLPTTPFVLVSAFCFSKSSRRLHTLLIEHRIFGPIVVDWEKNKVIRLPIKFISSIALCGMIGYAVIYREMSLIPKLLALLTMVIALAYIWSKPSRPEFS